MTSGSGLVHSPRRNLETNTCTAQFRAATRSPSRDGHPHPHSMIRVDGLEEPPVRVALEAVLRVVPKEVRIELTRREILLLLRREFGVGMQPQPEPRVPEPPQPRHGC